MVWYHTHTYFPVLLCFTFNEYLQIFCCSPMHTKSIWLHKHVMVFLRYAGHVVTWYWEHFHTCHTYKFAFRVRHGCLCIQFHLQPPPIMNKTHLPSHFLCTLGQLQWVCHDPFKFIKSQTHSSTYPFNYWHNGTGGVHQTCCGKWKREQSENKTNIREWKIPQL